MTHVIVGDEKEIVIPPLDDFPLGRRPLRGLRLIHTHLRNEPPSEDDLTDLALLRLDALVVLRLAPEPEGDSLQCCLLSPDDARGSVTVVEDPILLARFLPPPMERIMELERLLSGQQKRDGGNAQSGERGILVSVSRLPREEVMDSLAELKELARTAGVEVLDAIAQRVKEFNPTYLMGEGKLRELLIRSLHRGATILVFDQELSPAQARSISAMTELKVIDRSQLILDIFARRATTLDGKVQVELAQLKYLLPRLVGRGVQMSRLMGGIGGRGPGETKLEIDRRRIRERIRRLEERLDELSKNRVQRRQLRIRTNIPIISIVGYTNAGKSTLLNTLTKSDVFTEDLLFATLDTSTRRLRFPRERDVIITDTVGFIRSLPESLMGAFRGTLEELLDADLLIHLVDCSSPRFDRQIDQVEEILSSIGAGGIPRLLVFNKGDILPEMKRRDPLLFMKVLQIARRRGAITISAKNRQTLEPLMVELANRFWPDERSPLPPDLLGTEPSDEASH
ncbi:MAG: GTPase HflX [Desulfuromonadia bacterium]